MFVRIQKNILNKMYIFKDKMYIFKDKMYIFKDKMYIKNVVFKKYG